MGEEIINFIIYSTSAIIILITIRLGVLQNENVQNKKHIRICVWGIGILSLLAILLQNKKNDLNEISDFIKDQSFEKRLNIKSDSIKTLQTKNIDSTNKLLVEQNRLLKLQNKHLEISRDILGYSTSGEGNKPIVKVLFQKDKDGFTSYFYIYNYGQYPMKDIYYEIADRSTVEYSFFKEYDYTIRDFSDSNKFLQYDEYLKLHYNEVVRSGEILNVPSNVGRFIISGKIHKNMVVPFYSIKLWWNNKSYTTNYSFTLTKDSKELVLFTWSVEDSNGKIYKDLKTFYPLIPDSFWNGFDTKKGVTKNKNVQSKLLE